MSAHLIVPEDCVHELRAKKDLPARANPAEASMSRQHRLSGLVGAGLILLIVFASLYFALRYLI